MAELDLRILLSCLNHIGLMSKAVGKYNLASLVSQIHSRILSSLILRDIPFNDNLVIGQAKGILHLHGALIMCGRIAFILITDEYKTNL